MPGDDELDILYPRALDRAEVLIAVSPDRYSASSIARAVEDADCNLVNLNLTSERTERGDLIVALRVDNSTTDALVSSLNRYGYGILASSGAAPSVDEEESRRRVAELLHLIEL
ncbi:MAG: hypothetical protein NC082_01685 [Clostridiales bacterium]|nr:hypothetical protein [Clostridiales bacterium]